MKQFVLLALMTMLGATAALHAPYWGVLLYYTLAVLRPQYLWSWALPVDVRWSLLAAMAVFLGLAVNLARISLRNAANVVVGLMVGYGLLLALGTLTAYDPITAQAWGVEYAKVMLLALIASAVIEHWWQLRLMALMILLSLGYIAWEINFLYFFQGGRLDIFHYGYGGLDNNGAGLMIGMGLPFAYAFAVWTRKGSWWWKAGACAVLGGCIIHAVMMSYSRGAMLATALGMGWILLHHRPRLQAAGVALALTLAVSTLAGQEIRERFLSTLDYKTDHSAQSRLDSWHAAWMIAWEDPLLGKGIRNSNRYSANYGADLQGRTIHNQYLQIAADSGFPAAIVYISMLAAALLRLGRARRMCANWLDEHETSPDATRRQVHQAQALCLTIQASLIIFAVDGVFLSLELFELPWLLIVLGGVAPPILERYLNGLDASIQAEDEASANTSAPTTQPPLPWATTPRLNTEGLAP